MVGPCPRLPPKHRRQPIQLYTMPWAEPDKGPPYVLFIYLLILLISAAGCKLSAKIAQRIYFPSTPLFATCCFSKETGPCQTPLEENFWPLYSSVVKENSMVVRSDHSFSVFGQGRPFTQPEPLISGKKSSPDVQTLTSSIRFDCFCIVHLFV